MRFLLFVLPLLYAACDSTYPNRNPTGERFPQVQGQSLAGASYLLPDDLKGEPVLLLVGYEQNAQFDIDRWLLGLFDSGVDLPVFEIPTIPGLIPGLMADRIDEGMRSGIPSEDWIAVITVYDDVERIANLTGTDNGLNGRVILLDDQGFIRFFHDRGYSVRTLKKLLQNISHLENPDDPTAESPQ